MSNYIVVDIERIIKLLLKRIWLFILILILFAGWGYFRAQNTNKNRFNYIVEGELFVTQRSVEGEEQFLDNASRIQPIYDAVEILNSNKFLEQVKGELEFEVELAELKTCITVERLSVTRVLNIKVIRENQEEAKKILVSVLSTAQSYMEDIIPGVYIEVLETENISVRQEEIGTNGIKVSILMGLAVDILLAAVFIVLYLCNDSIRYAEDVERYLGLPVIGKVSNRKLRSEKNV